ncbi:MAG TPA: RNA polymerase sigma factor [Acidimicrobiales bacterium]|nr:RNA polymerase sigma factor [Acidimicrobiales bacterium]
MADLAEWLADGYAPAFRTACLIIGNRSDAEEAVQEAFLRAWRFRDSIGNANGDSVKPWLYRVVVNSCMSKLRQEIPHRDRRASDALLQDVVAKSNSPEEEAGRSELAEAMLGALDTLPQHLRIPVVLRYYAQLSEKEIAVAIKKRQGTVKSRLHEARRRLAENPSLIALAPEWGGMQQGAPVENQGSLDQESAR